MPRAYRSFAMLKKRNYMPNEQHLSCFVEFALLDVRNDIWVDILELVLPEFVNYIDVIRQRSYWQNLDVPILIDEN
jgi:hypothetical protein